LLVAHFVRKCAERQRKVIDHIPDEVMDTLRHHQWPGNIRELQNVIERAVIMTTGRVLRQPTAEPAMRSIVSDVRTLADAERAHIAAALRETNWVVGGWNGAAARLGVSRTTLIAKMQRLGLSRESAGQPPEAISPSCATIRFGTGCSSGARSRSREITERSCEFSGLDVGSRRAGWPSSKKIVQNADSR
jgi:Response regulator containing CheY-like receiver, AAA-type ATPase, and DNA-binding domains